MAQQGSELHRRARAVAVGVENKADLGWRGLVQPRSLKRIITAVKTVG
jgi:hypothetical protein